MDFKKEVESKFSKSPIREFSFPRCVETTREDEDSVALEEYLAPSRFKKTGRRYDDETNFTNRNEGELMPQKAIIQSLSMEKYV